MKRLILTYFLSDIQNNSHQPMHQKRLKLTSHVTLPAIEEHFTQPVLNLMTCAYLWRICMRERLKVRGCSHQRSTVLKKWQHFTNEVSKRRHLLHIWNVGGLSPSPCTWVVRHFRPSARSWVRSRSDPTRQWYRPNRWLPFPRPGMMQSGQKKKEFVFFWAIVVRKCYSPILGRCQKMR